tara:strand:- start:129 stop:1478 length:1350 start_codon:yes stop_codon:yes gene_type:complete
MKITVIGTGYVGLVTGACLSYVGNKVCCVDIDKKKISSLRKGEIPIYEQKLDKIITESVNQKNIRFTTDLKSAIKDSEIIFLAVSTPMQDDGSSRLDYILKAAADIGKNIEKHQTIIVKSTVPVGTTKKIEATIAKEIHLRKKRIAFDIVNNPEFLKEGKAVDDFMYPDRIIVGLENNNLKDLFRKLYRPFSMNHEKLIFLDIPSSELTKYAANAMLALKISFINEMSQLCEKNGANINDVRRGIGSDRRIGYSFIYPSIGFGGSCFPKDVNSLKKQFEEFGLKSLMSEATLKINESQGLNFVNRVCDYFKNNSKLEKKLSVWGITFKPGTDDIRESQAIKIIDILLKNNFIISIYDPEGMGNAKNYYSKNKNIKFNNEKYETLNGSNALLLLTEWEEFRAPDFSKIKNKLNRNILFDGRNIYSDMKLPSIGFKYFQIGVGSNSQEFDE